MPLNRIERALAFAAGGVGLVSILSILGPLIAGLAGMRDFSGGAWPAVRVLPAIGLPATLVLIIVFIVVRGVHQRRIARDGGH